MRDNVVFYAAVVLGVVVISLHFITIILRVIN
jgi:hypothetical protein